jgi:hypothetical protein
MPTNLYFNNYNSNAEQRVIEDLIVESIKIMGFDAFYLPNDNDIARDLLYGEDPIKKFQSAYPLEMYLSSDPLDYQGQQEFFSKFGLEIKDSVNVMLSKRSFAQRVPQTIMTRPREGDLVYVPFLNGTGELYEITFSEQSKDFHMLGRKQPYFYELKLEKFKYSQEVIDTGTEEIDEIVEQNAYTIKLITGAGTGTYELDEIVYQSNDNTFANATCQAVVQTWSPNTSILTITTIKGTFATNMRVIGQSSNARYFLTTYDPYLDNVADSSYGNKTIKTESDSIIDFSESNPFGSL